MATENAVMAAAVAKGTSSILNAASEPHVQGLCHALNAMGAKESGIGTNLLIVEGVAICVPRATVSARTTSRSARSSRSQR